MRNSKLAHILGLAEVGCRGGGGAKPFLLGGSILSRGQKKGQASQYHRSSYQAVSGIARNFISEMSFNILLEVEKAASDQCICEHLFNCCVLWGLKIYHYSSRKQYIVDRGLLENIKHTTAPYPSASHHAQW